MQTPPLPSTHHSQEEATKKMQARLQKKQLTFEARMQD
jgi:hypothetical protein